MKLQHCYSSKYVRPCFPGIVVSLLKFTHKNFLQVWMFLTSTTSNLLSYLLTPKSSVHGSFNVGLEGLLSSVFVLFCYIIFRMQFNALALGRTGFQSLLLYLPDLLRRLSYLDSVNLSFLICYVGIVPAPGCHEDELRLCI